MAPKVQVPTDFGRHLIGTPAHSNLVMKTKEGEEVRASSVILSFNSPVIENITTNLGMTSVDCDEFSTVAVRSFVLSCYVGELESCNDSQDDIKSMFRDLNKMAHVFEVLWLISKCAVYFGKMLLAITGDDYSEMLTLFEEARYFVTDSSKNRGVLIELTIDRIHEVNGTRTFLSNYFKDFKSFSEQQLDLIIKLAGNEVELLVQCLITELYARIDSDEEILTDNMKYLLFNTDLSICRANDRVLFETLFETLQNMKNISKEDLKLVFSLYRKSNMKRMRAITSDEKSGPSKRCKNVDDPSMNESNSSIDSLIDHLDNSDDDDELPSALYLISTTIPNLFHDFGRHLQHHLQHQSWFEELLDDLANNPIVFNFFMFAEALYTWMDSHPMAVLSTEKMTERVADIMIKRKWGGIPLSYISSWKFGSKSNMKSFFGIWEKCPEIVAANNEIAPCHVVQCYAPASITWEQLCGTKMKFRFKFKHPDSAECKRSGNCGFVLTSSLTNPDPSTGPEFFYNIELSTDPADYKKFKLHLHDEQVCADNMYLVLERMYGDVPCCIPISWCGRPSFKGKYWTWGKFKFTNDSPVKLSVLYDAGKRK